MFRVRSFKLTKTRSKYANSPKDFQGITYHSKLEAKYARDLTYRQRAGEIKAWQRQYKISLDVEGKHVCNYFIDFRVEHNDDRLEFVEVKGFETPEWRLKWKLFEALLPTLYPGATATIVK